MKKKGSEKTEYQEMMEFVLSLQEGFLKESDDLLAKKKDLEYKKRQKEIFLEEQEKRRSPNISMFSPLKTEDMYETDISCKDEIDFLSKQIDEVETVWQENKNKLANFERLKKFFLSVHEEWNENNKFRELTNYSTKLLETQELDRNRISRDLHDSTVQTLTMLVHKTEYCSKMIDIDPICAKLELQSMIEINKEVINDMREIIYDLRPMALSNLGFVATIESYCLHLQRNGTIDVILSSDGKEKKLPSIVSVTLYRILQEACNNAIKHSNAKHLWVRIVYKSDVVELHVEDDGEGFDMECDPSSEDELHGFGLSTMKERARLLNGTFSIHSGKGIGTKIQVVVPINDRITTEETKK